MKLQIAALMLGALALSTLAHAAGPQAPAPVQAPPPAPPTGLPPACDGQIVTIYHERIKQGGSLQGLIDAAKAQEDYWRKQGVTTNKIVVARISNYDKATKQTSYAADEAYTFHFNPPPRELSPQAPSNTKPDYIDKYRANATVVDRRTLCMPKF